MPGFKFKKIRYSGRGQNGRQASGQRGFLLTELIVAVFIFGLVMTISVGSLVVALDANKKAQSLKSVLNNLNVVLDTMTKTLAVGTLYFCADSSNSSHSNFPHPTWDCWINVDGENAISFLFNEDLGDNGKVDDIIVYSFNSGGVDENGFIERTLYIDTNSNETVGPVRMTAPEVDITDMKFYVLGSTLVDGDYNQPKVLITIDGNALAGPRNQPTAFTVQTLVSQRVPDFKPDALP